ncbi:MAG: ATP-binding protein [Promethearchaeota archaeon]
MIIFQLFFILNVGLLIINCYLYFQNKREFEIQYLVKLSLVLLLLILILFVFCLPFFIIINKKSLELIISKYINSIILFNLSVFFLIISFSLFVSIVYNSKNHNLELKAPSKRKAKNGSIKIGKIVKNGRIKYDFLLSIKDFEKHMFICGATGTGKSNFVQNFLINFSKKFDIPFFLVEFKGEYRFLQKKIKDLLILLPGENFSINIFDSRFSNPEIHAERIFDILKSGQFLDENSEYSPQMEKVLIEILINVCKDKNRQNWEGFEYYCIDYLRKNKNKIPNLIQTIISIKNRIRRFSSGPLSLIFEKNNEIDLNLFFQKKVILDLSSIIRLGGEKEDAFFFLNMILKYLWDQNLTKGASDYHGIHHITIIEDAQYFAPQDLNKKSKLTTYLEDIALLQRGTGECLITIATRPNISKEILANNGIVISFKNHFEKEIMCELLNLSEANKNILSSLEMGQCVIRVNSITEPFVLWIPHLKRSQPNIKEFHKHNLEILNSLKKTKMEKKQKQRKEIENKSNKEIKNDVNDLYKNSILQKNNEIIKEFESIINEILIKEEKSK